MHDISRLVTFVQQMTRLVEEVRALEPGEILATAWLPAYEDITEPLAVFERDTTAWPFVLSRPSATSRLGPVRR